VLHGLGIMAYEQGDPDEARASYSESLALRRKIGDKPGMIASLNNLANVSLYRDDYRTAFQLYSEALDICRDLDDPWAAAITLGNMGWVDMNLAQDYMMSREEVRRYRRGWLRVPKGSPGSIGRPRLASAAKGEALYARIRDRVRERIFVAPPPAEL